MGMEKYFHPTVYNVIIDPCLDWSETILANGPLVGVKPLPDPWPEVIQGYIMEYDVCNPQPFCEGLKKL